MSGRLAIGATLGAALVLSLTACLNGPKTHAGGPTVAIAQALDTTWRRTSQVEAYKIDETVTYSGFSQQPGNWRRTGDVRIRPSLAKSMTFLSGTSGGRPVAGIREIVVGDVEYVRDPALADSRPGKPWVQVSLGKAWQRAGLDYNGYAQRVSEVGLADETRMLTSSKDARKAGTETVGGTPTTHYAGTISLHDAWAHFDDRIRSQFEQYYRRLGITTIGVDIWVDRDSLPRKITVRVASAQGTQTGTVLYSNFGEAVAITAPPRGQVGDPARPGA
jgi:hypothetical protein